MKTEQITTTISYLLVIGLLIASLILSYLMGSYKAEAEIYKSLSLNDLELQVISIVDNHIAQMNAVEINHENP